MSKNVNEFLERYTAAWSDPSADSIKSFWEPGGEIYSGGQEKPSSVSDFAEQIGAARALVPDLSLKPLRFSESGNTLFVEWVMVGNINGIPLAWKGVDVFELAEDHSVALRVSNYSNVEELAAQLDAEHERLDPGIVLARAAADLGAPGPALQESLV